VPQWLHDLFSQYGYAVVFLGVFLENTGLPVPGETTLLAGAALAHFGELSLARVILFAMAGAVLGDNLGFLIGRRGGRQFIDKFCGRFGLTPERLRQFDQFFDRHGPRTVFVARFVTGLRVFGAMLAGASRMHWRAFLLYNALGAFTWCVIIGLAGYTLGQSWQLLEKWVGRTGLIALAAIVAAVVIAVARSRAGKSSSDT